MHFSYEQMNEHVRIRTNVRALVDHYVEGQIKSNHIYLSLFSHCYFDIHGEIEIKINNLIIFS